MDFTGKHVLIVVENLSVPFDRRVWQEATTLKRAGADVSVICPMMKGQEARHEILDGIEIYRHALPWEARGALGYLVEYGVALFWEFVLSWRIYAKKRFHVVHGCNPPDLIFLVALCSTTMTLILSSTLQNMVVRVFFTGYWSLSSG